MKHFRYCNILFLKCAPCRVIAICITYGSKGTKYAQMANLSIYQFGQMSEINLLYPYIIRKINYVHAIKITSVAAKKAIPHELIKVNIVYQKLAWDPPDPHITPDAGVWVCPDNRSTRRKLKKALFQKNKGRILWITRMSGCLQNRSIHLNGQQHLTLTQKRTNCNITNK